MSILVINILTDRYIQIELFLLMARLQDTSQVIYCMHIILRKFTQYFIIWHFSI